MSAHGDDRYGQAPAAFNTLRVAVLPGRGLVARYPGVICFISAQAHENDIQYVDGLLAICRYASSQSDTPGQQLIQKLAHRLGESESSRLPTLSFGTIAALPAGIAVLLAGHVRLEGHDAGAIQLSGADSISWLDRVIELPAEPISLLGPELGDPEDLQLLDLRHGVVLGGGATILRAGTTTAPTPSPGLRQTLENPHSDVKARPQLRSVRRWFSRREVEQEQPPALNSTIVRLTHQASKPLAIDPQFSQLPANDQSRLDLSSPDVDLDTVILYHPTHDDAAPANDSISPGTDNLDSIAGNLTFDDGTILAVGQSHIVGSAPDTDDRVRRGESEPVVLDDPMGGVAPAHFELRLLGDRHVELRDLESPSGTFIAQPGAPAWTQLKAAEGVILVSGTRIGFGRRTAVFQASEQARQIEASD